MQLESAQQNSYGLEMLELRLIATEIFSHFSTGQYFSFYYEAVALHGQDMKNLAIKRTWEMLKEEEKEYYIRLAILYKTGIDVRVDKDFIL